MRPQPRHCCARGRCPLTAASCSTSSPSPSCAPSTVRKSWPGAVRCREAFIRMVVQSGAREGRWFALQCGVQERQGGQEASAGQPVLASWLGKGFEGDARLTRQRATTHATAQGTPVFEVSVLQFRIRHGIPAGPHRSRNWPRKRRTAGRAPGSFFSPSSCFSTESVTTRKTWRWAGGRGQLWV